MKRAGNFPKCARLGMAVIVAFAPMSVMAAEKERAFEAPPPTAADFARLQREVAEQRALIIQMMQVEQQRYDMLLKLLQSGGQLPSTSALPPPVAAPGGGGAAPAGSTAAPAATTSTRIATGEHVGTVTGRVEGRGGAVKDAYVYV